MFSKAVLLLMRQKEYLWSKGLKCFSGLCAAFLNHCLHPYKKRFDLIKETDTLTKETFIDTVAQCIETGSCPHGQHDGRVRYM